jgi:hypothetical protein
MPIGTFGTITLTVGLNIPELTLTGSTLLADAVINLKLPGITATIPGTFIGGKYRPDGFGTGAAPTVPANVQTGYRSIILSSAGEQAVAKFVTIVRVAQQDYTVGQDPFDLPAAPAQCTPAQFANLKLCLVGRTITINGAGLITNIV